MTYRLWIRACCLLAIAWVCNTPSTARGDQVTYADFVFLIDATSSMGNEITAVKNGLGNFVTGLNAASVDARFAVILFGGAPELVQDFTPSATTTEDTFDSISVTTSVAGFQQNHNTNPEAGLEAIRIALGAASDNTLLRTNVGGSGGLAFRSNARKNLILVTDEDSDLPFYASNRVAGQSGNEPPSSLTSAWQTEVDNTADAIIARQAFINILMNATDAPSKQQYGDPSKDVADPDFSNFNAAATLTALQAAGYGNSLEGQVLAAGLVGRAFNIGDIDSSSFVDNFFAAKIEETVDNPVVPLPSAVWGGLALLITLGGQRLRRLQSRT